MWQQLEHGFTYEASGVPDDTLSKTSGCITLNAIGFGYVTNVTRYISRWMTRGYVQSTSV